jgi:hypothetical protein
MNTGSDDMEVITEFNQKMLNKDKRMLARVKRLQVTMMVTFEEAVKIVQISMLDDIKDLIDYDQIMYVRLV